MWCHLCQTSRCSCDEETRNKKYKVRGVVNMKILSVTKGIVGNRSNSCVIEFESNESISTGNTVKVMYKEKSYYFDVCEVIASSNKNPLSVKAREIGYYNKFSKMSLDIRELISEEVFLETDKETLKKLQMESGYC